VAFDVRVDCPTCRVEGARIETWSGDAPSERLGVPSATRCRLCGEACEGRVTPAGSFTMGGDPPNPRTPGLGCPCCGSPLDEASLAAHRCPACGAAAAFSPSEPGLVPARREDLARALGAWAALEGLATGDELVDACFVLTTPESILAALTRGEVVETTFDVVEYLFSSGHGQGGAPAVEPDPSKKEHEGGKAGNPIPSALPLPALSPSCEPDVRAPPSVSAPASLRRVGGPRDELLALASVAASDGVASEDDLEALAEAAAARGLLPLPLEDIRVRRPTEIDPPPTLMQREKLLEEMFHLAWSDDELDESEVRVVREFARAWGVDPQRVTEWTRIVTSQGKSRIARWIDRVGYFLFPGW
jgi:hypothetical protein